MMSCATTPLLKPFECCSNTLPILFTTTKPPYPYISFPSKPLKLTPLSFSFSSMYASLVSSKSKLSHTLQVLLVAQTSDWAPQQHEEEDEEESPVDGFQVVENSGTRGSLSLESKGEQEEEGSVEEEEREDSYPEPPEEAKLFVGNLPYDIDSEKLAQIFYQAGVVEIAEVIYNRETDQSRGFGFVTMSTVEEAEKAVEMFNRYDLSGRLLTVNKAAPKGSQPERVPRGFEPSFRIYVGNLPWQVDSDSLEQVFSEHGKVIDARVVFDRETGRSRGFGFVKMSSETELNDAIAALDGQSLDGRAIRVNVAEERPRLSSS